MTKVSVVSILCVLQLAPCIVCDVCSVRIKVTRNLEVRLDWQPARLAL